MPECEANGAFMIEGNVGNAVDSKTPTDENGGEGRLLFNRSVDRDEPVTQKTNVFILFIRTAFPCQVKKPVLYSYFAQS